MWKLGNTSSWTVQNQEFRNWKLVYGLWLWTCVYCAYIPQQIEAYIYINKQTRSLFLEMVDE
jgi:hypothetical protein